MSTSSPPAPPPKKPPTPPPSKAGGVTQSTPRKKAEVISGILTAPKRVVIYGSGGIGKSELASLIINLGVKPLFIDLEGGTDHLDVRRVNDVASVQECRDVLHDEELCSQYGAIVIDTFTKFEELCAAHAIATVPHEKGHWVKNIEDYGFGKGFGHIYDAFLLLLQDLDGHVRRGRHVIGICHDCTANVPNPAGEDWLQYQPRLQSPPSGKNSIRHRTREWADYLLFIGYDTAVNKDGKATGVGTRTIYPKEMPTHMAKSRGELEDPIVYERGSSDLWQKLLNVTPSVT